MKTIATVVLMIFFAAVFGYSQSESTIAAGQKLFLRHCSECHGSDGLGTERGPSLAEFVKMTEPGTLRTFIKNGNLRRGMPSWSRFPDQRLNQLVVFLKSAHRSEE